MVVPHSVKNLRVTVDPNSGFHTYTGKITPGEPEAAQSKKGYVSVDALALLAEQALKAADFAIWILLDRLDVAFAETHELEKNALRALFRVYLDFNALDHIKLKVFLRSDIWSRIVDSGFREATLPELCEWGRKHPELPKVSQGTINKQLGAVQTIAGWGHRNGIIPEDVPWSDPFFKMRVEEDGSDRTSFESPDLKLLFAAPVFTAHEFPEGGRGYAAFWLPLLALLNGARQAELAGLTVADVKTETETQTPLLFITKQTSRGKRLKTKASQRVIPIHPQLVKLGFLNYVEDVRRHAGEHAFLFPLIAPQHEWDRAGVSAWSKWFGRYLDAQGVTDTAKVFHSFRHGFKDALRKASPDEELRDALTGHRGPKSVGRDYGAKEMLTRFGIKSLKSAVGKVAYQGLDLSRVRPMSPTFRN